MSMQEVNVRAQERLQIGFCCAYERCGARLSLSFSHYVALRIWSIKCEWDNIPKGEVSCSIELAASVQMFCSGIGKALRTHLLYQHDSPAERTQKVDGRKSN